MRLEQKSVDDVFGRKDEAIYIQRAIHTSREIFLGHENVLWVFDDFELSSEPLSYDERIDVVRKRYSSLVHCLKNVQGHEDFACGVCVIPHGLPFRFVHDFSFFEVVSATFIDEGIRSIPWLVYSGRNL